MTTTTDIDTRITRIMASPYITRYIERVADYSAAYHNGEVQLYWDPSDDTLAVVEEIQGSMLEGCGDKISSHRGNPPAYRGWELDMRHKIAASIREGMEGYELMAQGWR